MKFNCKLFVLGVLVWMSFISCWKNTDRIEEIRRFDEVYTEDLDEIEIFM